MSLFVSRAGCNFTLASPGTERYNLEYEDYFDFGGRGTAINQSRMPCMVYGGEDVNLDDSVLRHSAAQASILSFLTLECRETHKLPQHGGLKRDYRSFF
jgi:hypothetical protein